MPTDTCKTAMETGHSFINYIPILGAMVTKQQPPLVTGLIEKLLIPIAAAGIAIYVNNALLTQDMNNVKTNLREFSYEIKASMNDIENRVSNVETGVALNKQRINLSTGTNK